MNPALVYDIETEDWDQFVLGTVYDGKETIVYHDEESLVRRIVSTAGEVWAHNGGRYDHLWFLDAGRRLGLVSNARITLSGVGIVSIKVGKTTLLDSWRVFPMPLATLTNGAKRSLSDLCTCPTNCGGYCAIRRDMPPHVRARVEEYAIADVVELWKALEDMARYALSIRIDIGWTVAGTAWRSAARELGLPESPHRSTQSWAFARRGYYGGRDEILKTVSDHGERYDINQTYPAMLSFTPIPIGKPRIRWYGDARSDWMRGRPGIYTARCKVPAGTFAPSLPLRSGRTGRLVFPTGTFTGTWARPEIEHALTCGVEVLEWIDAMTWDRAEILFAPWVKRLFAARFKAGKKSREGIWIKAITNSMTGRLGTRCEVTGVTIDPQDIRPHTDDCEDHFACHCGAHLLVSRPEITPPIYKTTALRIMSYAHPAWAAYLTAAARVALHRKLDPTVVYCATDSRYCERSVTRDVGEGLGQWLHEGPYWNFMAIAPKVYRFHDGTQWVIKAKGIPKNETTWEKIVKGEPVHYMSRASVRRPSEDGSFFHKIDMARHVTPNTGARVLVPGSVETRAPTYQEVCEL